MVVHPQYVTDAHNAGCAAAKQGKFVEFKREFWDKAFGPYSAARDPSKLGVENIMAIAKGIGLDTTKLKADMDGPDCKAHVQADMAELQKFHVNSTPSFFIRKWRMNSVRSSPSLSCMGLQSATYCFSCSSTWIFMKK